MLALLTSWAKRMTPLVPLGFLLVLDQDHIHSQLGTIQGSKQWRRETKGWDPDQKMGSHNIPRLAFLELDLDLFIILSCIF